VSSTFVRAGLVAAAMVVAGTSAALAQTSATPAPGKTIVAQAAPAAVPTPLPTPNPLTWNGFFRSYYFTRQNATGNPGTQNAANQASWNNAIDLHADYHFAGGGWYVGGSYLYAQPFTGACSVAAAHAKGDPCVSQKPPNTNPDDTLPGFMMSTFPETYLGFKNAGFSGMGGDMLFNSPWAGSYDGSRLKPVAYRGVDVSNVFGNAVTLELGDFWQFENRTSNTFTSNTLLTSFPAGNPGMAPNIVFPGGTGVNTSGFFYGKLGYAPKGTNYSVNGYLYSVSDLVNVYWGDARYTWSQSKLAPYVALQGGWENNGGASYIGKIQSSLMGVQIGANVTKNVLVQAGFDSVPWRNDTVSTAFLSSIDWACNNSKYQLAPLTKAPTRSLGYFLPVNAGQCYANPATGTTSVYYGGWASPYTDAYATDPIFTTSITQGMADRRAPGNSWKVGATFTSNNKRVVVIASDAWYNYGNALVGQNTNEWNLDGQYRFSPVKAGRYRGLLLRYRYAQRSQSNTFCGASSTSCAPGAAYGSSLLGGSPLFKYNRAQLEYDF
jgi:hypothetical protein